MFCKTCGKELKDEAAFCTECGTPAGQVINANVSLNKENNKEDNVVRLEIKPTFIYGYHVIKELAYIFLLLICITCYMDISLSSLFIDYPFVSWIVFGGILLGRVFFIKSQYEKTNYRFLKTKVEYIDGFFNKEEKQLKYEHIREITMSQNILENFFGIGRIRLYTNANSAYNTGYNHRQTGKNGIDIHCVSNVKELYVKAKAIIDEIDN